MNPGAKQRKHPWWSPKGPTFLHLHAQPWHSLLCLLEAEGGERAGGCALPAPGRGPRRVHLQEQGLTAPRGSPFLEKARISGLVTALPDPP